jgi:hypothetical protein
MHMLRFLCRYYSPLKPHQRFFSSTRLYLADAHPASSNANVIHEIEQDGSRILQAVKKRVKLRDELLANVRPPLLTAVRSINSVFIRCPKICPLQRT